MLMLINLGSVVYIFGVGRCASCWVALALCTMRSTLTLNERWQFMPDNQLKPNCTIVYADETFTDKVTQEKKAYTAVYVILSNGAKVRVKFKDSEILDFCKPYILHVASK
jgi:hypothetical protein